jgi:hypothetical protein
MWYEISRLRLEWQGAHHNFASGAAGMRGSSKNRSILRLTAQLPHRL